MTTKRAYGTWSSPLQARHLADSHRLLDIQFGEDGATLVWLESRAGQTTLVMQREGDAPRELTERDTPIRGGVGYGGGEFTVQGDTLIFTGAGGRLVTQSLAAGRARPITPAFGSAVSPRLSPNGQWVAFVHTDENTDGLALVDAGGHDFPHKLAYGTDFVMQPAWHPAGDRLAYITWDQPRMPWDGSELRMAALGQARGVPYIISQETLAGGEDISIFQPEFSPDGRWLSYVSDESGWWRLYLRDLDTGAVTLLTPDEAEYGGPAWTQGMRKYGWSHDSAAIYALRNQNSVVTLWRFSVPDGTGTHMVLPPYTALGQLAVSPVSDRLALFASGPTTPARALLLDFEAAPLTVRDDPDQPGVGVADGMDAVRIIRRTSTETLTDAELSEPRPIQWQGPDGEVVHGNFYPPASARFEGVGLPPLIVHVHGGPTSQAPLAYNDEMQFYATRGFAVLQVNHRGSTGYGKAYRDKQRANWGGPDVEDAASGAAHLAEEGLVDARKLVILGGSAGGYTVLQSLVDKPGFWKAGVCLYGISNQFTLVSESGDWKFESRYSEMLLGPLPEAAERYRDRSPVFHAERIVDPVIIFQGEEDVVVPRSQSDSIVAVLAQRGVPHEYHVYAGEGHGWRKPETREAYLGATLKFLEKWVIYA
jgi:dipeptidyl aminopeptidase/acylaminoacyl peptidase